MSVQSVPTKLLFDCKQAISIINRELKFSLGQSTCSEGDVTQAVADLTGYWIESTDWPVRSYIEPDHFNFGGADALAKAPPRSRGPHRERGDCRPIRTQHRNDHKKVLMLADALQIIYETVYERRYGGAVRKSKECGVSSQIKRIIRSELMGDRAEFLKFVCDFASPFSAATALHKQDVPMTMCLSHLMNLNVISHQQKFFSLVGDHEKLKIENMICTFNSDDPNLTREEERHEQVITFLEEHVRDRRKSSHHIDEDRAIIYYPVARLSTTMGDTPYSLSRVIVATA